MKTFSEKVREARENMGISQAKLAEMIDVSVRSVTAYETGAAHPRGTTARRLSNALGVSADYLLNDAIDDPDYGNEKAKSVDNVRELYGERGAKEMGDLLEQNRAFFAGGEISEDAKDAFFSAVMAAYVACKEKAKRSYGRENGGE